jgi:hypothetical protein
MATIVPRKRKDGSTGYLAQIIIKRQGKVVPKSRRPSIANRRQPLGQYGAKTNYANRVHSVARRTIPGWLT